MTQAAQRTGPRHFSHALELLGEMASTEGLTLGKIAQELGSRSMGALLLFLALPMVLPIPAPGISVVFGLPLTLICAQLLAGRRCLWLPKRLAEQTVSRGNLRVYLRKALPLARKLEKIVRPRLGGMTRGFGPVLVGAMGVVLALIITLPIPLGHLVPGTAISLMALGLMERDGLAIILGLVIGAMALFVVTVASMGLVALGQLYF